MVIVEQPIAGTQHEQLTDPLDVVCMEDNGVRETDPQYRRKIDEVIQLSLAEYPPTKLIKVEGDTNERIATILQNL